MEKVVNGQNLKEYFANKKVLVTGHTGFKGSWLSTWLQMLGSEVYGYALAPEYDNKIYDLAFQQKNEMLADIRDAKTLVNVVVSFAPDFIFHLAAQPLVRKSYTIPAETFEVNAIGTANLLESVSHLPKKCTIIVVTTDKVYENQESGQYYNESDTLGGYDPYSASKACTEIVVQSFRNSFFHASDFATHQKAIASARAGNVIGGGDYSTDRIVPDIIRALEKNEKIILRNPSSVRPWQHVLEPLGGYLLLGGLLDQNIEKYSGAYNFGPEKNDHLTVQDLAEKAIGIYGKGEWENTNELKPPHEAGLLQLDISKAKNILGWEPKLTSKEAIEWTIQWYKENEDSRQGFTKDQIKTYMDL